MNNSITDEFPSSPTPRKWGHPILSVAKEIIQESEKEESRALELYDLATTLVREREWERAEALIGNIEVRELRIDALLYLGDALVKAEQWSWAEAIWNQVEAPILSLDTRYGITARNKLAISLIEARQWERADELVKQMLPGELEPDLLMALGKGLIQAQQWERAAAFLERMKFRERPPLPFVTTGKIGIPDQEHTELQQLLRIELIRTRQWERVDELIQAFLSAHQNQETIQSIQVTLVGEDLPGQPKTISSVAGTYPGLLLELGRAFEQEGQRKRARVIWKEFERVIQAIERKDMQALLIYPLAETLEQVGDYSHLLHLLRYAWVQASTRNQAINLLPLAYAFIPLSSEIGSALCSAFSWVDSFLKG
jgi:tetratricopeptide (TPR) repeat protein